MLYVYQGAVETEVPGKQIARMIFAFFFFHLDNMLRQKSNFFIIYQVEAFMNSTIERDYRQDNPTAVTVSLTLIEQ